MRTRRTTRKYFCYYQSTKYFKAFYNYAKRLEDKVGMGFALNRVACGLYYQEEYREAIHQNERGLEMMDEENVFAAFYNSGIFLRKVKKFRAALEMFDRVGDFQKGAPVVFG